MLANPHYQLSAKRHSYGARIALMAILLLAVVVGGIFIWLLLQTVQGYYANRIYPNVYVLDVALGGLTVDQASVVTRDLVSQSDAGLLILRDGESRWSAPRWEAGIRLNLTATVQSAFAVGHTGDNQDWLAQTRLWLARCDIDPIFMVDTEPARVLLERLSPIVYLPPTDASLHLESGQVVVVPAQPGRALDIKATLAQMAAMLPSQGDDTHIDLVFKTLSPGVADVAALQAEIENMLDRYISLWSFDALTRETLTWNLEREQIITWLSIESEGAQSVVRTERQAVQATLASLTAGLGDGRGFRLEEATDQVLAAWQSGGGTVALYLTHPSRTWVVQPGNMLESIAKRFGMPCWAIIQANPGVDFNILRVGQEVVIPSPDVLVPYLPAPDKRLVISIEEQKMRVYQDNQVIYDWVISTGVDDSPTHRGVFQILSKEENAYAGLWDLWMPHFMAIYESGPDFYNGIHALPILSSGRRLWEGLLGSPASYGCIILGVKEAETLFQWADVGVLVIIE